MTDVVLYDYPKSSASYRVRIALNLAEIAYLPINVNLLEGDHREPDHLARNPQGLVPVLEIDGLRLTQSLAIIEYLDRTRRMELLPKEPALRARVQALAMVIAVDLHPVCNLSVALRATGGKEPDRTEWMRHFIGKGLRAFETLLGDFKQCPFATGAAPRPCRPLSYPTALQCRQVGRTARRLSETLRGTKGLRRLVRFSGRPPGCRVKIGLPLDQGRLAFS